MKLHNQILYLAFLFISLGCKQANQEDHMDKNISVFTVLEFREGDSWVYKIDRDITSQIWAIEFKNYEMENADVRSDGHAGDGYYLRVVVTLSDRDPILLSFTNSGEFIIEENVKIQSGTPSEPEAFKPVGSNMRFKRDAELSTLARKEFEEVHRK